MTKYAILLAFYVNLFAQNATAQTTKPKPVADTLTIASGRVFRANLLQNDIAGTGKMAITGFYVKTSTKNVPGKTVTIPGAGTLRIDSNGALLFVPLNDTFKGVLPAISYMLNNGLPGTGTSAKVVAEICKPLLDANWLFKIGSLRDHNMQVFRLIGNTRVYGKLMSIPYCDTTLHYILFGEDETPFWYIPEEVFEQLATN